jgi:hypothetical protein
MTAVRLVALTGLWAGILLLNGRAGEINAWPFWVGQTGPDGHVVSWNALGPLFFEHPDPTGGRSSGFRPFYTQRAAPDGSLKEATFLYPIFTYRSYGNESFWTVFDLINHYGRKDGAPPGPTDSARVEEVWPFYFSRDTGDPATSYRALFPIAGTVRERFWSDRLQWVIFPLYLQRESKAVVTTYTPWPFIRFINGAASGFALWPLYGSKTGPGANRSVFYLWPLGWDRTVDPGPDAPPGASPKRQVGFLPFFSAEHGGGVDDVNYLWPFFGYTDRTVPNRYHETRYLWPFFVQGQGDDRMRNRWGPFYTHSVLKGYDKTWVLWPIWRQARWSDDGKIEQTKTQFCYVLYWSLVQRSVSRPAVAPAMRTHLWPLISIWDNGAGRRQWQFLSPFDVFFPTGDEVRESWTPLFALARYDRRGPDDVRGSLLWGAVSWERRPGDRRTEVHLGPLKLEFSAKAPSVSLARRNP